MLQAQVGQIRAMEYSDGVDEAIDAGNVRAESG